MPKNLAIPERIPGNSTRKIRTTFSSSHDKVYRKSSRLFCTCLNIHNSISKKATNNIMRSLVDIISIYLPCLSSYPLDQNCQSNLDHIIDGPFHLYGGNTALPLSHHNRNLCYHLSSPEQVDHALRFGIIPRIVFRKNRDDLSVYHAHA